MEMTETAKKARSKVEYLPLGARVRYTKRASTRLNDYMRDMPKGRRSIGYTSIHHETAVDNGICKVWPQREYGQRVVEIWDEEGEGIIVGIARRQEGRLSGFSSYDEQAYLSVDRVVTLYQVRSAIDQMTPVLVPVDAVEVLNG